MTLKDENQRDIDRDLGVAIVGNNVDAALCLAPRASPEGLDMALWTAACRGQVETRQILMKNGGLRQTELNGLLGYAAASNDVATITKLLDQGANIHDNKNFPLKMAGYYGHKDAFDLLIDRGADIMQAFDGHTLKTMETGDTCSPEMFQYIRDIMAKTPTGPDNEPPHQIS